MRLLPLISFALMVAACGGDGKSHHAAGDVSVTIPFAAEANGVAISCDAALTDLGTSSSGGALRDFRFYVHNVRLIKADNTEVEVTLEQNDWQNETTALIDFLDKDDSCGGETKETHTAITGTVPAGDYTGVAFTVGVPEDINHVNQAEAPSPLNIVGLFWSWQSGYKFMKLEVAPTDGITRPSDETYTQTTFNFHLGSTGCTGNPELDETVTCERADRPEISLTGFDVDGKEILIDYAALLSEVNINEDLSGPPGCMSGLTDNECPTIFTQLGLDFEAGTPSDEYTQTVFSVRDAE